MNKSKEQLNTWQTSPLWQKIYSRSSYCNYQCSNRYGTDFARAG